MEMLGTPMKLVGEIGYSGKVDRSALGQSVRLRMMRAQGSYLRQLPKPSR